jgi:hypothetical protein
MESLLELSLGKLNNGYFSNSKLNLANIGNGILGLRVTSKKKKSINIGIMSLASDLSQHFLFPNAEVLCRSIKLI